MTSKLFMNDSAYPDYREKRINHWDSIALHLDYWRRHSEYYHARLTDVIRFATPPGQRVLEIGCGRGDLLAALNPSVGVGVDFSGEMINLARKRHPQLKFIQADIYELQLEETFDTIIVSDVVNELWDVQQALKIIRPLATKGGRVIFNFQSRLWEIPLLIVKRLKLSTPTLDQNWLTFEDVEGLLGLTGFEVIRRRREIMFPFSFPFLDKLMNMVMVKLWPLYHFALTNFVVARPRPETWEKMDNPLVSVVVPARNEAGNVSSILDRTPEMGAGTELIFVEGHSSDNTYETIKKEMSKRPDRNIKLLKQSGTGKGSAVREAFDVAKGDILMILDADMTVAPEDLPRFLDVITSGQGEFVNGVRLVYPMEDEAMRSLNLLGNKFFSMVFSWLLDQPVKDTLCGTKVLSVDNYRKIASNRSYFGEFDPFGDFDLLFGAAKANMKIVDMPVRYRARTYGSTNIDRWRHGWLLLKMAAFATKRLKFI